MSEVKEGLFDKLYSASKEAFDLMKKPIVKNKLKQKLKAAFYDAQLKIGEASLAINKTRESFDGYDINKVLEQRQIIVLAEQHQKNIQAEYLELFGVAMPTEE